MFKKLIYWLIGLTSCLCSLMALAATMGNTSSQLDIYPHDQKLYDDYPWALTYYYGFTVNEPLIRTFIGQYTRWPEHIQSVELAKTLDEDNPIRRFFRPVFSVVQFATIATLRVGSNENTIYEVDPYFAFRWTNLPWNNYVTTSFAIGEGVSYVSSIPAIEKRQNDNTKRLLNYLMFEASFAPPTYPQLQLIARIHHRSGAFGLYHAGNTGSNDVGVGIRYLFD